MTSLYERLGITKDSTKSEIRAAYRKASKKSHPDAGGSPEKFALVKRAHDILTDEERRRKYDDTGDESEVAPENGFSAVSQILAQTLENVMVQIERKNGDPSEFDVIGDMKILLQTAIDNVEQKKAGIQKNKKKAEKMLGRFKTKKGPNILEGVFLQKIASAEIAIDNLGKELDTAKKAYELLKDYSFDFTPKQQGPMGYSGSMDMSALMSAAMRGGF